jgi:hypothetical protein
MGGKGNIVLLGLGAWSCVGGIWVEKEEGEEVGKEVGRIEGGGAQNVLLEKHQALIEGHDGGLGRVCDVLQKFGNR